MKCEKCGAKLTDGNNTCPNCGTESKLADTRQIETLRENIVKTAKITPEKAEEINSEKLEINSSENTKVSSDTKDVSKIMKRVFEKTNKASSEDSNSDLSEKKGIFSSKLENKKDAKKKTKGPKKDLIFVRFLFAAILLAFGVSLFFNWFSISGDAVNIGVCRDGHMEAFLEDEVKNKTVDELHGYKGAIIKFTPFNMIIFAESIKEEHLTVRDSKGEENISLASNLNKYYMYAMLFLFISVLFSIVTILVNDKLKYINVIWALSIANAIVIGLNYMAMKLAFFNIFAIKAKSILKARDALATVKLSYVGVTFKDQFFSYNLSEEKGFYISLGLLLAWFLMATVLKELRYRRVNREEIAKEKL